MIATKEYFQFKLTEMSPRGEKLAKFVLNIFSGNIIGKYYGRDSSGPFCRRIPKGNVPILTYDQVEQLMKDGLVNSGPEYSIGF